MKINHETAERELRENRGCKSVIRTFEAGRSYAFLALSEVSVLIQKIEASPAHREILFSDVNLLDIGGNVSKALCLLSELLPEQTARIHKAIENNKHLFDTHYFDRYPDELDD
ncbi:MAG: hypothetical protein LBQ39_10840 [Tannerellaceae bacterium]|jgi:hypothetical protein|nr:hypothetical protein [Tannerellaceae bacterium]